MTMIIAVGAVLVGGNAHNVYAQANSRTATLTGFIARQQEGGGIYTVSISASDAPLSATFFLTNTVNNERSSVVANCAGGSCVKHIDTLSLTQGTYVINARVAYPDGTSIKSNQIVVDIPVSAPPVEVSVDETTPIVRPKPVRSKPVSIVKKTSIWGYILKKVRFQQNTPEQQIALAAPLVQEIKNISIGLQGGERDIADAVRRLGIIESEFWEGTDGTSPAVQAKTQYQGAREFGATTDVSVMRVTDIAIATTTKMVIASSTTTNARGEQVIINQRKQVTTQKLHIGGKVLPNMYVTVYVYGPVSAVGVVKAGSDGKWTVEFGDAFADGSYEVYAAIEEYTGKIIAKSERVRFAKQGETIIIERPTVESISPTTTESVTPVRSGTRTIYLLVTVLAIGIGMLVGVVVVIRRMMARRRDEELNP